MELVTTGKMTGTAGTPAQVSTSSTFGALQHATLQSDPNNSGLIYVGVDNTVAADGTGVWFWLVPGQVLPLSQNAGNVWDFSQLWWVPENNGEAISAGGAIG